VDFAKVRHDFTVYVVDSETTYCDLIADCLKTSGYHVETFMKGEDVIEQSKSHPPHIVIYGTYLLGMTGIQLTKCVRELSPDIQLIITANYAESELASEAISLGACDRIYKPVQNVADVISVVDRVAERRFLEFSNEALYGKLVAARSAQRNLRRRFIQERTVLDLSNKLQERLKTVSDAASAITTLAACFERELSADISFFRYLPLQGHFICTHTQEESLRGLQLNLTAEGLDSEEEGARDVLTVLLGKSHFDFRKISNGSEILGLLVIGKSLSDPVLRRAVDHALQMFQIKYELYEAKKQLFQNLIRDEVSGVWNKSELQRRTVEEISRSRRLKMPVSTLLIGIDRGEEIKKSLGQIKFNTMIEKFVGFLQRTSRATDIIGRCSEFEFGVLLPHTPKLGAAIKAEKFRRLIERSELEIRVSIGVSEYPSICMDADTLWNAADSAYFQVKRIGNKVCLAAAPKSFEPDFLYDTL